MDDNQTVTSGRKTQCKNPFPDLVGKSPTICRIRHEISQVASTDANVLIQGKSGTGKEVVARHVHYNSKRGNKAFVPINCGAIPHDLLESELFGHEKGAFTGAITSRQGRFAMAEGGTLFLDEIGEMTMAMQVKLLRVLEERVYERVGGNSTIHTDVRIIAATNRNLEEMVSKGEFREDLYFRLDVFPINLPPLCERIEDLPLLIDELISRLRLAERGQIRLTPGAIAALSQYDWPGNIRELSNQLERLAIKFPNGLVQAGNLPEKIRAFVSQNITGVALEELDCMNCDFPLPGDTFSPQVHFPVEGIDLKSYISNIEASIIQTALERSNGIIANAAKLLGLQRTTLSEKMRKYQIGRDAMVNNMPKLAAVSAHR